MKIRPVGAELLRAVRWTDGQTDMTKRIAVFRSFCERAQNTAFRNRCFRNVAVFKKLLNGGQKKKQFVPVTF